MHVVFKDFLFSIVFAAHSLSSNLVSAQTEGAGKQKADRRRHGEGRGLKSGKNGPPLWMTLNYNQHTK